MEIIVLLRKVYAALQSKETLHHYLVYEMGELLYDLQDDLYTETLHALLKFNTGEKNSWEQVIGCLSQAYERLYQKGSKTPLLWLSQTEAFHKQGLLIKAFSCALLISISYHHLQHHCLLDNGLPEEFEGQSLAEKRKYIQAANEAFELYVESTMSLAILENSSGSHRFNGYNLDRELDRKIKLERGHWHLLRELLNK